MLLKTHLAINFLLALFLSNFTGHRTIFIALVLISSGLADIDNLQSYISRRLRPFSRIVGFFSKHRELFHSLTLIVPLSIFIAVFSPFIALAFFLGYSMHIFADSLTVQGVRIFWPHKLRLKWKINTNSIIEKMIFFLFLLADVVYLASVF